MSVLALSSHKVIWLTKHNVKGCVGPPPPPVFVRRLYTRHACSGWAPFISWEQASYSMRLTDDYTITPPYIALDDPWYFWMLHNYGYLLGHRHSPPYGGVVDGGIAMRDYRNAADRYLVSTYIATIQSADNDVAGTPLAAGIKLRHILKRHKRDNAVWYDDWSASYDGGVTWASIYHYSVSDDGTVTASGGDGRLGVDLEAGICGWIEDWIINVLSGGGWYPTVYPYVNASQEGDATVAVSAGGISLGFGRSYSIDLGVTWFRHISISIEQSLSNEFTWGVPQAQAECRALSDSVNLGAPGAYYPPGTGPGTGTQFTYGSMLLEWSRQTYGPDIHKMLRVYSSTKGDSDVEMGGGQPMWDPPEGDYPEIDLASLEIPKPHLVMRVAANLLDTGNNPPISSGQVQQWAGEVMMIKTVMVLKSGAYTVRTRNETKSHECVNGPPDSGPPPDVGDGVYPTDPWTGYAPQTGAHDQYADSGADTHPAYATNTPVSFDVPASLSAKEIMLGTMTTPIIALSKDQNPIDIDTRTL